ncbi:MAG TPA: hypothetical protein VEJ20_09395, partial [Candidatus Eremiobacteraceae bacterium]|nr:hypothetical protein [Candidatus Eremiobacteraceae bacterium]
MMGQAENVMQFGAALAHALADGIWVGAAIAVALHLYLRTDVRLSAASRHAAWYAALVVIALLPFASFITSLTHISFSAAPTAPAAAAIAPSAVRATHPDRPAAVVVEKPERAVPLAMAAALNPAVVRT